MVSGEEIDIIIDEEFRAGQGAPITKEEIYGYFVSGKEVGSADSELSKGSADAAWHKID
jgi:hypothetical protein